MDDPTLLSWIERGQNIAALLVAIGVAAEFVLGFMAVPARHRLDQAKDAELLQLAGNSKALENQTAELRNKNLQLEALIQPRDLTIDQQKAIGNALRKFPGKFVLIWWGQNDLEAWRLGALIRSSLKTGGILSTIVPLSEPPMTGPRIGVDVIGKDSALANAIMEALIHDGALEPAPKPTPQPIVGTSGIQNIWSGRSPDAEIFVGLKPLKMLAPN
jgi:hypothetical protein